jgi:hypothetical protein
VPFSTSRIAASWAEVACVSQPGRVPMMPRSELDAFTTPQRASIGSHVLDSQRAVLDDVARVEAERAEEAVPHWREV